MENYPKGKNTANNAHINQSYLKTKINEQQAANTHLENINQKIEKGSG